MSKHVKISMERAAAAKDLSLAAKDILDGGFEDANLRRLESCLDRFEQCGPIEEEKKLRFFKVHMVFVGGTERLIPIRGSEDVPNSLITSFTDPTPIWVLLTPFHPLVLVKEKIMGWTISEVPSFDN